MKILGIIQARLGSTRCPGKVMREVKGKPMIGYMLDRVCCSRTLDDLVVALPKVDYGSKLHEYVASRGIAVYAGGEENDLCERFHGVLAMYPEATAFVRLCGDSPMIDPQMIDDIVDSYKNLNCGFLSNAGLAMIPKGQHVEICAAKDYHNISKNCLPEDREHAGFPWVYRKIAETSLAVDTEQDFLRFETAIGRMTHDHVDYSWPECVNLYARS